MAIQGDRSDYLCAPSEIRKRTSIDQEEATRLVQAIRKATTEWIQVQGVEFNAATSTYELKCLYRQGRKGLFHQESWTTLWIKSPRQWIELPIKHGDDLEIP